MELNLDLKKRFGSLAKSGKISHSYMIIGGDGSGKLEAAMYFASCILCGGEPCGVCYDCDKVKLGVHPDVILLNDGEDSSLKIDEIRYVVENINIPPVGGKRKIYILNHCETMTPQAQNALLKAFEEPPEYVVFILLTEKKEAILPTVRSRASMFTVSPMSEDDLLETLKEKYKKEPLQNIKDAVKLSEGFYGRAVKLLEKGAEEERKKAKELSSYLLSEKSAYKAAKLLHSYKNKRDVAIRVMFYVVYSVRDTVLYKNGRYDLCFLTAEEAERFSVNSIERLSNISDGIIETISSLSANGNYTSCIAKLCGTII